MRRFSRLSTKVIEAVTANDLEIAIQNFFIDNPSYFLYQITGNSGYCVTVVYIINGND